MKKIFVILLIVNVLFSCRKQEVPMKLILEINKEMIANDGVDSVEFSVFKMHGLEQYDIEGSDNLQIFDEDDNLVGTTFKSTEIKNKHFFAKITQNDGGILISDIVELQVVNYQYAHKTLLEDFTGTWCGNCTRVLYAVEQLHEVTDRVLVAAVHRGDDPFDIGNTIASPLETSLPGFKGGYPYACLNRKLEWKVPISYDVSSAIIAATNTLMPSSPIGIKISSNLTSNSGNISVDLAFGQSFDNPKIMIYVMEDSLVYRQANYYNSGNFVLYGGAPELENFVHLHVVRTVVTNIMGDAISGLSESGEVHIDFNNISFTAVNAAHLKVLVAVLDQNSKVMNVQVADANSIKDFELKILK